MIALKLFAVSCAPYPVSVGKILSRFGWGGLLLAERYHHWYVKSIEDVIRWHRRELEDLSPEERITRAQIRMMADRARARENGIGPADPRYPSLPDYLRQD